MNTPMPQSGAGSKDAGKKKPVKPVGFVGASSGSDYYRCHYGTIPVFSVINRDGVEIEIAGGGETRGLTLKGTDLFIDLANIRWGGSDVELNDAAREFKSLAKLETVASLPTISIDWPDFSTPRLGVDFWLELAEAILNFASESGKKKIRVTIACRGGHGRTGTALSILACLLSAVPPDEDPVKWVRQRYCKNAVETESQLDYIEEITGCTVTAGPARGYTGFTGWGWSNRKNKGGVLGASDLAYDPMYDEYKGGDGDSWWEEEKRCDLCFVIDGSVKWRPDLGMKLCDRCYEKEKKEVDYGG